MTPLSGDAVGEVTVGIDIGTTSVKAVAADAEGNVVARARMPHKLVITAAARREHDANQAGGRGPRRALEALGRDDVRAVSVPAMVPSFCAVDRRGIPRTPGLLYGDARGRAEGQARISGDAGEALEFLRWTSAELPGAHGIWPAQAVANFALAGQPVIDGATAFSAFPLYGLEGWDEELVTGAGAQVSQLPRMEGNGAAIGTVEGTDTVLAAGAIDAMGEQIVAGADEPGDVLVINGTTLITWAVITEWREVPNLWTIPHTTPERMFIGGPSNAGGLFLNWACSLLGRPKGELDPHRVPVWNPYVRGERVPVHDPDRRSAIAGLDLTHTPAALRRAAYESAGFAVRHQLDLAAVDARRIVATGGGTRVPEWMQAPADCTGLPVDVVAVPEGAALGGAFVARMALGLEPGMHDAGRWARRSHRVEPRKEWIEPASERYQHYRRLAE